MGIYCGRLFVFLVTFVTCLGGVQAAPTVIGLAFDLSTDALLYTELHSYSENLLKQQVVYVAADHAELAVKQLDYGDSFIAPSFVQHSRITKENIKVSWVDQQLSMTYLAASSNDSRGKNKKIVITGPLVIDAGFDYYIRENWPALMTGKALIFDFVVPARLSLVALKVQKTTCRYSTSEDVCFAITAANWLIRLVLAPIELGYNMDSRRLSRYRGLANISDQKGVGFKVDIHYRYFDHCQHDRDCQQLQQVPALTELLKN